MLASCSGDSEPKLSKETATAIRTALLTKGTHASFTGTITIDGRSAAINGEWTGGDLATDARVVVTGSIPFLQPVPLDLRISDGAVSSQRSPRADDHVLWPAALVSESPGQPVPILLKIGILAEALGPIFAPALLAKLEGTAPEPSTNTRSSGTVTYKYPGKSFPNALVVLTTNGANKLKHVTMSFGSGANKTTIDYEVTLTSSDPLKVEFPSTTTTLRTNTVEPAGPFVQIRAGVDDDITWSALRAPGPRGRECWKVETTPTITVQEPNHETDTRCVAIAAANDDPVDQPAFALSSNGSPGAAIMLVRVPAGTSDARFGFIGGRMIPTTVESSLIVWAGTHGEHPSYLEMTLPTDERLGCGLGAVATKDDLTDEQIANTSFKLPWTCELLDA